MGSGSPVSICFLTAATVALGISGRVSRGRRRLKRLQKRADDGAGELRGHPVEGRHVLLEKRVRIGDAGPARRLVFLTEQEAWIFPQHLVLVEVAQLDPRRSEE